MTRNYYYLIAGLPELLIDSENKGFSIDRFKEEVQNHVHSSDWKLLSEIFRPYDIENILYIRGVSGVQFNNLGNYTETEFLQAIDHLDLPQFMVTYIHSMLPKEVDEIAENEAKQSPESHLWTLFYEAMEKSANHFLRNWYSFDRDFRNILAALACRNQQKDIASSLIGNGELVESLSRSTAPDFGIKKEIDYLERIFQIVEQFNLLEREKKFDQLRWQVAEDYTVYDYFNVQWLMAFFVKATIVSRWLSLDRKHGEVLFQNLVNELKSSFELSSSFKQ
jgi:Protein of unknown function (DUF2764).